MKRTDQRQFRWLPEAIGGKTVVLAATLLAAFALTSPSETVSYSYDGAGRLIRADYGNGKSIEFTYDPTGNLLRRRIAGAGEVVSVNAASYNQNRILAPGAIAFAAGSNLGTGTAVAETVELPTELLGTRIDMIDSQGVSRPAGLIYVTPSFAAYVLPSGTALGPGKIVVHSGAGGEFTGSLQVNSVSPGIFTANQAGTGVAAAYLIRVTGGGDIKRELVFDAGTQRAVPLDLGVASETYYLEMYGTGCRGFAEGASATVGGADVPVAGPLAHSVFSGLDQFNLGPIAPNTLAAGEHDIMLTLDGQQANTVTIEVQ